MLTLRLYRAAQEETSTSIWFISFGDYEIRRRSSAKANAPSHSCPTLYPNSFNLKCLSSSSIIKLNRIGLVDAPCLTPF